MLIRDLEEAIASLPLEHLSEADAVLILRLVRSGLLDISAQVAALPRWRIPGNDGSQVVELEAVIGLIGPNLA